MAPTVTRGGPGVEGIVRAIIRRYDGDRTEWRLGRGAATVLLCVPFLIAGVGLATMPFVGLYDPLAREDGIVEWMQVAVLVGLILMAAAIARLLWRLDRRLLAVLCAMAAVGRVVVAGEEISWGQRIIGWATPEALDAINRQGETNIHNIGSMLKVFNLGVMGLCAAAIVMPIARWTIWRHRRPSIERYVLVPPLALIPAFAFPFVHRAVRLLLIPDTGARITRYSEFAELSFYLGLVVFAVLLHRALRDWVAVSGLGTMHVVGGLHQGTPIAEQEPGVISGGATTD